MHNSEIAEHFSLLSKLMDIHGENSFKSKTYANAAFTIDRLPHELAVMDDAELYNVRGIGEATGKKIRELLATGKLPQLEELVAATPPGILEMLQIKGLGPKKISVIWNELGIESLGELEYACNENRLVTLKGFGAKTQESVLQQLLYYKQNLGFYLWAEAETYARNLLVKLQQALPAFLFAITGDIRMQREVTSQVALVTTAGKAELDPVLGADASCAVQDDGSLVIRLEGMPEIHFYETDAGNFYKTLFLTSCGTEFRDAFCAAYTLPENPATEEAIFEANKLHFVPAMRRESPQDLDLARRGQMPALIQPTDIRGIIHSHSNWSDGQHSLEQMARAAKEQGYEYLVLSDHSQTAFYANGLKPDRIAAQHQAIDALNAELAPFRIFKSIESDILGDGSLDYTPQVLATFDLVIASVHSNLKMTEEKAMERILGAIRNPYTTILGHPTGRLLLSRKGYPLDFKKVIDACAAHHVVIEINAHPRRLDLDWRWVSYALERGVLLSIDPDAHAIEGFHDTYYGVMAAQKGGLTAACNLSSFSRAALELFLEKQKQKRRQL